MGKQRMTLQEHRFGSVYVINTKTQTICPLIPSLVILTNNRTDLKSRWLGKKKRATHLNTLGAPLKHEQLLKDRVVLYLSLYAQCPTQHLTQSNHRNKCCLKD